MIPDLVRSMWAATTLALLSLAVIGGTVPGFAQSASTPQAPPPVSGKTIWVTTTQRLKTKVYESFGLSQHPILIVVAHGDAPRRPPTYQYRFAQAAAAAIPDAVVAAVLRPGYSDGEDRSDGIRGETTGDNYTPEIVHAVATALSELQTRYHPRRVILIGHSGGAAIMADLLGREAIPVDAALLVSCPCDLVEWRKHMRSRPDVGGAIWDVPVNSLSPIALVDGVPRSTRLSMLVGSDDQIAPPSLTLAYAEALRKRDVAVDVTVAPNLPHDILLEPIVLDRLKELLRDIDKN